MIAAITRDEIRPGRLLETVSDPAHGASVLFLGTVRDHHEGRTVTALGYEAYEEMAERVLREVAEESVAVAGPGARIAVEHRVGALAIGDVSVAVAVSSAHRAEAFEAARRAIDELKTRVPIWKRERCADGSSGWLDGQRPAGGTGERIAEEEASAGSTG